MDTLPRAIFIHSLIQQSNNPFIHFSPPLPFGVIACVEAIRGALKVQGRFTNRNNEENVMKKIILVIGAAASLILAGCDKGGTSDQYGTSSGGASSSNSVQNGATNGTGQ